MDLIEEEGDQKEIFGHLLFLWGSAGDRVCPRRGLRSASQDLLRSGPSHCLLRHRSGDNSHPTGPSPCPCPGVDMPLRGHTLSHLLRPRNKRDQLPDIMCNGDGGELCADILIAAVVEASEATVILDLTEDCLRLYRPAAPVVESSLACQQRFSLSSV